MNATVAAIRRYPVKGLSGQDLPAVDLASGQSLPFDRRFGLLHGPAALDPDFEGWRPNEDFFTLDRNEKLALLDTEFDEATQSLIIRRAGKQVSRGRLDQPMGRMLIEQFFAAYLAGAAPGLPKLAEAKGFAFTDREEAAISILNLASVRDLEERVAKQPVDPRRFRANLMIDGLEPWVERQWIGGLLRIGGATLRICDHTECRPACEVNPATGARDLNVLPILERGYDHTQCGVYARVVEGGRVTLGDPVALSSTNDA
ncbi:MOSC domain-containing protein [Azospirillum soli]|uniref:MOSC domain-containing protein n=1 Tax=Azospirillum soli TaxID=1304799 RepID=UPI001AE9042C|nr:MOSC domain-containing protein [Azospirillum soli]MBP2314185.1 uncharacterized protein YcbX [Azospirillum soli]